MEFNRGRIYNIEPHEWDEVLTRARRGMEFSDPDESPAYHIDKLIVGHLAYDKEARAVYVIENSAMDERQVALAYAYFLGFSRGINCPA